MPYQYAPTGPGSHEHVDFIPYGPLPLYNSSAWKQIVSVLTTAYNLNNTIELPLQQHCLL